MNKDLYYILFAVIVSIMSAACSSTEDITDAVTDPVIDPVVDVRDDISIMSMDGFYPGDDVTRATLEYGKNGLAFSWETTDKFGVYPCSSAGVFDVNATEQVFSSTVLDPEDPHKATASSENTGFHFDPAYSYAAYYLCPFKAFDNFNPAIPFDFTDQTQKGYVNMIAYKQTTGGGYDNATYKASEQEACKHLSDKDVLFSPAMPFTQGEVMRFKMRHIGAVARFYLLTPSKKLKIKELKLISNNKIFYEKGTFDLSEHPYNESHVPSTTVPTTTPAVDAVDNLNYGVSLPAFFKNNQLAPDEASKTDHLTLKFDDGTGTGSVTTLYDKNGDENTKKYGCYFVSYLMMYPITTSDADDVYIYVTAEDESGKTIYLRSEKLANKTMYSGYVYQWTVKTTEDTPIELTATLQPWQEIVGKDINLGLTEE